ncbi:hypothetical protein [Pedobacter sp. ASV28]|uniref:hypothetical protein n=1 Tax=Pedobacter sp. ASV28 TaxID=2795123 RepID=UPI0018EBA51A|nr:hypothetical protein [Pedobacter sp. ASV28]
MMRLLVLAFYLFASLGLQAQTAFQQKIHSLVQIQMDSGVTLSIDEPIIYPQKPTEIVIYALPNGNTTAQTFGKKVDDTEDWHYNIQHIGAQSAFVRQTDQGTNYIIVYAENKYKSWPSWRRQYQHSDRLIRNMVDKIYEKYQALKPQITLSGHSGGGSFVFGYINAYEILPNYIERIVFLEATYGYEPQKHLAKLKSWLQQKNKFLQVIAYNDSVVVYNGKPLVSATGGTLYRSKLMARDLQTTFELKYKDENDREVWKNKSENIAFLLIKNPEAKILHTILVEKNGFIHLVFNGTKFSGKHYQFWANRAYDNNLLK